MVQDLVLCTKKCHPTSRSCCREDPSSQVMGALRAPQGPASGPGLGAETPALAGPPQSLFPWVPY